MQFRAEFFPKPFIQKISHRDAMMLVGSCFTEQVGNKLAHNKFNVLQNPNGILFNPISICEAIESYIHNIPVTKSDLFYSNELWGSWRHHTRFSSIDAEAALQRINEEREKAHQFLQGCEWLMLTLGSAFVYELVDVAGDSYDKVVANCHKVPTDKFNRRLLKQQEIVQQFSKLLALLKQKYPHLKVIFTISPVRHLREGFIENNRSKAALISAVHELLEEGSVFYFPAYELVLDDLRDYRFY
ncbi:MAG: GSCFA domain-containing protein, partial [Chitinophagaceae bacterium]